MKIEIGFGWLGKLFANEAFLAPFVIITIVALGAGIPIGLMASSVEVNDIQQGMSEGEPVTVYHVTITPGFVRGWFVDPTNRRVISIKGDNDNLIWVDLDDLNWEPFSGWEEGELDDLPDLAKTQKIVNNLILD